jgi:hypothetical protein
MHKGVLYAVTCFDGIFTGKSEIENEGSPRAAGDNLERNGLGGGLARERILGELAGHDAPAVTTIAWVEGEPCKSHSDVPWKLLLFVDPKASLYILESMISSRHVFLPMGSGRWG